MNRESPERTGNDQRGNGNNQGRHREQPGRHRSSTGAQSDPGRATAMPRWSPGKCRQSLGIATVHK
ncbi:hypothetical protein DPMN_194772 [Dreissena polymorpha]|uniref:Uncharacterized protein n=1 Tax=Dreissena polymorpha TaxID=45954 RepID=A0A9D3Y1Q8_DREPO|nr:hypothetical protein DPMN_194772 [Dreissena polymorpha]